MIEVDAAIIPPGSAALLCKMLRLNPEQRVSARFALEHSAFFSPDTPSADAAPAENEASTVDVSSVSAASTVGNSEPDALVGNVLEEEEEADRICGAAQCEDNGDASSDSSAPTPAADRYDPPARDAGEPAVFVAATGTAPSDGGEGGRRLERPPATSPAKRLCRGLDIGGRSGKCTAT